MTTLVSAQTDAAPLGGWDADLYERVANSGGPSNRRRTERLSSTVLGRDDGAIRCPRTLRVGLDFGRKSPLASVRRLLTRCGFANEHDARAAMALPLEPCLCRPDPSARPAPVDTLRPEDALYQALVLGLCTPWRYDPDRPVLWTRASLTRHLELFDGGGFYA